MGDDLAKKMDVRVAALLARPEVKKAMARIEELVEDTVAATIKICEVEAPPFLEGPRAELVADMMREVGLSDVHVDEGPSAVGFLPAESGRKGEALLLAAHIDTVFPAGTDVRVKREGGYLVAPGVSDNSASVAGLLTIARVLRETGITLPREVIFAGNAGEEGLGDLRGMKVLMRTYKDRVSAALPVDGAIGAVTHAGVGSRRFKVTTHTPGGHSYGAFGVPSAIHGLGRMIAGIADVKVASKPKTTYTVGVIGGGTSVNTIAPEAWMLVDMRSESADELTKLEAQVRGLIDEGARRGECTYDIEVVGDRPAGGIPLTAELPQMVMAAHRALGIKSHPEASSTDANVPLSMGIPAVTIGVKRGHDAHLPTDRVEIDSLVPGMKNVLLCILLATGYGE
ncbi:MAG: M20/M25/M40 family metallo-hydrolase [Bacillota bacterium]|nr:M20/M25/M40 family metallo-hydrolase [Bacillota bacterium]